MKKIIIWILIFTVFFAFMQYNNIYAENLEYIKDGINSVDENEMLIYPNKMNLKHALETNDITLTGDLSFIKGKTYTDIDFSDGTFDSERGTFYTPTRGLERSKNRTTVTQQAPWVIAYTKPISTGEYTVDGTATIRFREAAKSNDDVLCDVIITMDNISVKTAKNLLYGMTFLESLSGGEELIRLGSGTFQQEKDGQYYLSKPDDIHYSPTLGASYDISIKIVKTNTNNVIDKKIVLLFKDIDNLDYTTSTTWVSRPYTSGGKYAENITFINGFNEIIHLDQNSLIGVDNHPEYGNNTIYYGTQLDDNTVKSSLSTRANTSGYKLHWAGSNCSTHFGFIDYYSVSTAIVGEHKDHGTITKTDDEVFWKEDKEIIINPDRGYKISKITVDGETISFEPNEDDSFKYTFPDVMANHNIEVELAEQESYIIRTKTDGNGRIDVASSAKYKEYVNFKLLANDGYKLKKLTITSDSGKNIIFKNINGDENNILQLIKKFIMPNDNVTIEAGWEKNIESLDIENPKTASNEIYVYIFITFILFFLVIYLLFKKKLFLDI